MTSISRARLFLLFLKISNGAENFRALRDVGTCSDYVLVFIYYPNRNSYPDIALVSAYDIKKFWYTTESPNFGGSVVSFAYNLGVSFRRGLSHL